MVMDPRGSCCVRHGRLLGMMGGRIRARTGIFSFPVHRRAITGGGVSLLGEGRFYACGMEGDRSRDDGRSAWRKTGAKHASNDKIGFFCFGKEQ